MSTNAELATIFAEMAGILELTGANRFRVNAHDRVARVLEALPDDVAELADDPARLTAIDGIGEGSAKKIIEYVETGRIGEHDELRREVPAGLLDVLKVPGLGPKTVRALWEKGGVVDIATLRAKLESGELESIPRMGKKTLENIRDNLAYADQAGRRLRLGAALPIAENIVEHLQRLEGVTRLEYAGSLRRGRETIGDIDILACTDDPAALTDAFTGMGHVDRVIASGETKSSVRLADGVQVDLRIVDPDAFGAALLYFTGSKEHNVVLRERSIKRGMRLNEYGLFPDEGADGRDDDRPPQKRGISPVASRREEEIYRALDLPYIPPELREDRGEFDHDLPELVEVDDIRAELHAHTTASDGTMSIDELAEEARARGLHTIAVTDHSRSSVQANGLSDDRLREHIDAVRDANTRIEGITLLAGSEVDILADGRLDYGDDLLAELDVVVASPHSSLRQDRKKATARLLRAIRHPLVHILGHPTGRMINSRPGLDPDISRLVDAAVEHETALEINANPARLDLRDTHVRAAVDAGALLAINTDAHSPAHFDFLRYGVLTARRGWLPADRCLNTWSSRTLHAWLKRSR